MQVYTITQKITFLKCYNLNSEIIFAKKVRQMLKDEKYFIASECARILGFSKQYFSESYGKHISDSVIFGNRKYYKLKNKLNEKSQINVV